MAANADTVAVEVEARLQGFTTEVNRAAQNFDQQMDRIQVSATGAEAALRKMFDPTAYRQERLLGQIRGTADGVRSLEKPFLDATTRSRQLGIQIGQMGASMASGGNVMVTVAQQASDFAYVLGGTTGVAGRLATFFSTSWGAALLAASLVLGTLISRHKEADDASGGQENSERKLSDAIRELDKQTRDAINSTQERNRLTELSVQTQLNLAIATRATTAEILRQAIARAEANKQDPSVFNEVLGAVGGRQVQGAIQGRLDQQIATLNNQLQEAEQHIDSLTRTAAQAAIPRMLQQAAEATDAAAKATGEYERALDKLNRKKGIPGLISDQAYDAEARKLMTVRDAALEAARAADRLKKAGDGVNESFRFQMPVQGQITSGFGARTPPTKGASSFHPAIDIAAPFGTPVHAAAPGVVVTAGRLGGLGNVVIVDHGGGTISEYGHLSSILAQKGQEVGTDTVIGKVGSTGISTGNHLDYRVKVGGKYVDPRKGVFPIDQAGTASRVVEAQQRAEDVGQRQTDTFNAEMTRLQAQLVTTYRGRVVTSEAALAASEDQVLAERDASIQTIQAGVAQERITDAQGKLLIAKVNELATAKTMALYDAEALRVAAVRAAHEQDLQSSAVDQAQFEQQQARTSSERRDAAYRLLDAEIELERMKQQQIADNSVIGSVEHQRALDALKDLDRRKANGQKGIATDPANMGAGGQFLQSLPTFSDSIERTAVNALKSMNDEIAKTITGAESIGDAFKNMSTLVVSELAKIAVQEFLIKPIANLLFGGNSTGGGVGGILGSLGSLFGGGGGGGGSGISGALSLFDAGNWGIGARANGGPVSGGVPYMVGERGPELFVPSSSGAIVPNGARAMNGGGSSVIEIRVGAGEYFDARVERVSGPLAAQAAVHATRGGSIMARQGLAREALHRLE